MIIERDVAIAMDDGIQLKADIYRPEGSVPVPVIMTLGPYGKGVRYQDHYAASWSWMTSRHPDILSGSAHRWLTWETVDPEIWVPWGYAVVRVDSRGAGRSPGCLDILSPREVQDYYHAIEWAGTQPWSNGKVGLNGISYYAINQWRVAALQPPHLAAIVPWEGAADAYRDFFRHGGILSNRFLETWYPRQVLTLQHGNPDAPRDHWLEEPSTGPDSLSPEELRARRIDLLQEVRTRVMDEAWYQARSTDWTRVTTPFLSAANWAGFGLHPRGNFEAFMQAAAPAKWLEVHPGRHEEWFYLPYGMELQKRFLDHYLKGEENGWDRTAPVMLNIRRPFTDAVERRDETEWPIARTRWTRLHLDARQGSLGSDAPADESTIAFDAMGEGVRFASSPLAEETEVTGPLALRLHVSSTTEDADLFVTMLAFSPDGREVEFMGSVEPHAPLAQGWLRVSHRKLCPRRSLPVRPFHTHDEKQPLEPGAIYEVDVEIWPTCIVLPAGFRIVLDIRGQDFVRPVTPATAGLRDRGSGPWLHTDGHDRPARLFAGRTTIHTSPERPSFLLLPVIPGR